MSLRRRDFNKKISRRSKYFLEKAESAADSAAVMGVSNHAGSLEVRREIPNVIFRITLPMHVIRNYVLEP